MQTKEDYRVVIKMVSVIVYAERMLPCYRLIDALDFWVIHPFLCFSIEMEKSMRKRKSY